MDEVRVLVDDEVLFPAPVAAQDAVGVGRGCEQTHPRAELARNRVAVRAGEGVLDDDVHDAVEGRADLLRDADADVLQLDAAVQSPGLRLHGVVQAEVLGLDRAPGPAHREPDEQHHRPKYT